jgi:butyrate kinase
MSLILVINPGSTSTKLSIFDNLKEIKTETLRHDGQELLKFKTIANQKNYRLSAIENFISKNNYQ